ncbi:MAG TPA: MMPL family transporter [Burkholderiaceae bacterium]|nr:MMPL family transporter [Burkholderiaceae bacterium]
MSAAPDPMPVAVAAARRPEAWLWVLAMVAALVVAVRANYVADLSAFLPAAPTAEQRVLLEQLRSGVTSRILLVGIRGGRSEKRVAASQAMAAALRSSGEFRSVDNGDTSAYGEAGQFLFDHRYLLSPAIDARRFTVDGLREGIDDTVALLGTPAGTLMKPVLWRDPTGETIRLAEAMLPAQAPRSEGGVWVSRSEPRALLVLTMRAEGDDLDGQARAIEAVRRAFAAAAGSDGMQLEISGLGVFAVQARAQIRGEIERLATAGTAAIIALLFVVFGSWRALLVGTLPVASGVLAGIAAVSLGFGRVHGVTLGFGTTLIGEAVDYAIYFLIQSRPAAGLSTGRGRGYEAWVAGKWPTVRLGLWTSLAGFSALVFSGFPGLAQLGVFSLAGLVAAALTTRYVLPLLAPDGAAALGLRGSLGRATSRAAAWLPRRRVLVVAVVAAAVAALAHEPAAWRGNLAALSPVPPDALKLDASLRADLAAAEAGILVAVEGADEGQVLQRAEAAGARLDALVRDGALLGYSSPANLLPSPATQRARAAALPSREVLTANLVQATQDGPLPFERLGPFIDDVESERGLPAITRRDLASTPLAAALDAQLVSPRGRGPWTALINLQLPPSAPGAQAGDSEPGLSDGNRLRAALAGLPDTRIVEVQRELDALYARYLREAQWQAAVGALVIVILLGAYLRSATRLLRVLVPLAASEILVLAGFAVAHAALGVLHLVGLLLVVAVGSNYALFFDHLRERGDADADTLASLFVANLTTVISFGLLATSDVPALSAVGMVVAPGAALALVLSAALIGVKPRAESAAHG